MTDYKEHTIFGKIYGNYISRMWSTDKLVEKIIHGFCVCEYPDNNIKNPVFTQIVIGHFCSVKVDGNNYSVGISICDPEDHFNYNADLGKIIAYGKAIKKSKINLNNMNCDILTSKSGIDCEFYMMPMTLGEQYNKFIERCNKYYKLNNILPINEN